jgi:hypothetical protein
MRVDFSLLISLGGCLRQIQISHENSHPLANQHSDRLYIYQQLCGKSENSYLDLSRAHVLYYFGF